MIDPYNPNQLQPNMINPNAMSNMQTLQGINGVPMVGSANRTIQQYPGTIQQYPGALTNQPQYGVASDPFNQNSQTGIMPNNNY